MKMEQEAGYACPSCGEEIVVPIDVSAGEEQEYTEDCPVCCAPVQLRVRVTTDGDVTIAARSECGIRRAWSPDRRATLDPKRYAAEDLRGDGKRGRSLCGPPRGAFAGRFLSRRR